MGTTRSPRPIARTQWSATVWIAFGYNAGTLSEGVRGIDCAFDDVFGSGIRSRSGPRPRRRPRSGTTRRRPRTGPRFTRRTSHGWASAERTSGKARLKWTSLIVMIVILQRLESRLSVPIEGRTPVLAFFSHFSYVHFNRFTAVLAISQSLSQWLIPEISYGQKSGAKNVKKNRMHKIKSKPFADMFISVNTYRNSIKFLKNVAQFQIQ